MPDLLDAHLLTAATAFVSAVAALLTAAAALASALRTPLVRGGAGRSDRT